MHAPQRPLLLVLHRMGEGFVIMEVMVVHAHVHGVVATY